MRSDVDSNHDFIKRTQKIQLIINSYEDTLSKFQKITDDLEKKFQSAKGLTSEDLTPPLPRPGRG